MRFVVIGAGSVGGTIAGKLVLSGADVTIVARGDHGEQIRRNGLDLRTPNGRHVLSIPTVSHPSQITVSPDHVVVLATKSGDSAAALDALRDVADPDAAIVCMQNGTANERCALRRFRRVYGACVFLPASHLEAGVVRSESHPIAGSIEIGRYPGGIDATVDQLGEVLQRAGFHITAESDVMRWKYGKLLDNLGNALEAACGPTGADSDLASRARDEALACYAAAGIECASRTELDSRHQQHVAVLPVDGVLRRGGSSWQSLARGTGRIEADWLNGEIVLLGRLHGCATPVNEMLQRVANEMARRHIAPGTMTVEELTDRVGSDRSVEQLP